MGAKKILIVDFDQEFLKFLSRVPAQRGLHGGHGGRRVRRPGNAQERIPRPGHHRSHAPQAPRLRALFEDQPQRFPQDPGRHRHRSLPGYRLQDRGHAHVRGGGVFREAPGPRRAHGLPEEDPWAPRSERDARRSHRRRDHGSLSSPRTRPPRPPSSRPRRRLAGDEIDNMLQKHSGGVRAEAGEEGRPRARPRRRSRKPPEPSPPRPPSRSRPVTPSPSRSRHRAPPPPARPSAGPRTALPPPRARRRPSAAAPRGRVPRPASESRQEPVSATRPGPAVPVPTAPPSWAPHAVVAPTSVEKPKPFESVPVFGRYSENRRARRRISLPASSERSPASSC